MDKKKGNVPAATVPIRIPRALWKRLKVEAARREMQLGTLVEEKIAEAYAHGNN